MTALAATPPPASVGPWGVLGGAARLFVGLALSVPAGIVITALLSRGLGPEGYGVFTVAAALVLWLQLSATQLFGRTVVAFAAGRADWAGIASVLLRAQLALSVAVAVALVLAAPLIAALLRAPALTPVLWLFALDVPLFALAAHHGSVLIALGRPGQRSVAMSVRWAARVGLVLLFTRGGFTVAAVVAAYIVSSLLELLATRAFVRVPWRAHANVTWRAVAAFALPIWAYTVALELFGALDLLLVQALLPGGVAAGLYGAARTLTMLMALMAVALAPIIMVRLRPLVRDGRTHEAAQVVRQTFALLLGLLPLVALAAASTPAIVRLLYGEAFVAAAPVLSVLLFGAVGVALVTVGTAMLVAAGRPAWTAWLTAPLVPLALVGHLVVVPRAGLLGAAGLSTGLAWACALAVMLALCRPWRVALPWRALAAAVASACVGWAAAALWDVTGWAVVLKLGLLALPLAGLYALCAFGVPWKLLRRAWPTR